MGTVYLIGGLGFLPLSVTFAHCNMQTGDITEGKLSPEPTTMRIYAGDNDTDTFEIIYALDVL